jgi:coenzyme Q-binding protein COQ10
MAGAQSSETFNCTPEQFFAVVTDYEKYPEFLQEVKQCKVLKVENSRKLVEYSVSVVKSFKYCLWMTETKPSLVKWEFASGEIFKTSSGFWKIEEESGKTRATYSVEATFGLMVPGPLAKVLVSVNLPNMMAAYHKRIASLYG